MRFCGKSRPVLLLYLQGTAAPYRRPLSGWFYPVFGREDAGLPEELLAANQQQCVRMPMRKGERCLNLSNAVAVGVYEVLRQWDFADLETHGQLTRFEWK